jgi:hypothetical protein
MYLMIANIFITATLLVCLEIPQAHAKDKALDLLGYFADKYGGNKDGKFGPEDILGSNPHTLGAVVCVMYLDLPKGFAEEVLKQSIRLAEGKEYKRAYEDKAVGLAIVLKARQLNCLDSLRKLKDAEWLSNPDMLARTDMADLGGAFLVSHYSLSADEIRKVLAQGKHGRKGLRIFITALLTDWSPPNIHRPSAPKLPREEEVVKKVSEVSQGVFAPQVFSSLSTRIPGKTSAEKIGFLIGDQ